MNVSGSPIINIGNLAAGRATTVSWIVKVDADASGSIITVSAGGKVSGAVPQVYWNGNQVSYPADDYTDEIGGEASIRRRYPIESKHPEPEINNAAECLLLMKCYF